MSHRAESILVTGGAGFIGSNFIRSIAGHGYAITNYDALTYAGNLENLADLGDRITFVHGDVCNFDLIGATMKKHEIDTVVHFAAESHVDRSILGPLVFTQTNVIGTHTMLEAARQHGIGRFVHISTDEVYGSLGETGSFTETSPLDPTSPYAASKAASDLIVLSYCKTFGMNASLVRCSNNYGPYQFPEKLIPLMITNAMRDVPLPVYGDGLNVRDWIHTRDFCSAIHTVMEKGIAGDVYNVGCSNEWKNLDIVRLILRTLGKDESLITYVKDRPAHDRRYAIDSTKIQSALGWTPQIAFEDGIRETIQWYLENAAWWERVKSGAYRTYYELQYGNR